MILKKQFLRHLQGQHNSRKQGLLSPRHTSAQLANHNSRYQQNTSDLQPQTQIPHAAISAAPPPRLQISQTQSQTTVTSSNIEEILAYIQALFQSEVSPEVENDAFALLKKIEFITMTSPQPNEQSNKAAATSATSFDQPKHPKKRIAIPKKLKNSLPTIMNNLAFIYHRKDKKYASHLYSQKAIEQDTQLNTSKTELNSPAGSQQCWDITPSPRQQTLLQPKKSIGQIISILNFTYTTLSHQQPLLNQIQTTLQQISVELQSSIRTLKALKKNDAAIFNSSNRILIAFPLLQLTPTPSCPPSPEIAKYQIERTSHHRCNYPIAQIELEGLSFYYLGLIESLTQNVLSTSPLRRSMEVFQPIANFCKFNRAFFDSLSLLLGPISDISSSSLHSNSKSISSTPRTSTINSNPGDQTKRSFSNRTSLLERPSNQRRERTSSNPEKPLLINLSRPQLLSSQQNPPANNNIQNKGINYLYATELPAEPTTRTSIRQQKTQLYSPRGDSPHQLFKSSITTSVISAEMQNSTTPKSSMDSSSFNNFSGIGSNKTNIKARRVLRVSNEHTQSASTKTTTTNHNIQNDYHKSSFILNSQNHNRTFSSNNQNAQQQQLANQENNEVSYHVQISHELQQQPTTKNRSSNSSSSNLRVVKRTTTPRDSSEKQQRTILKEIHRFLEANAVAKPNINQFKQFSFNKLSLPLGKPDLTPKNNNNNNLNRSISPQQISAYHLPDSTSHLHNNQKRTTPKQDQFENNENSMKIRLNQCASSEQNKDNQVSSQFIKYCQKQSLASSTSNGQPHFRGSQTQFPESKVLNQERSTQDNFSILETANSVASKVISEESKSRVISSFCRFSTSNIECEAQNTSPKKSIESVDKIYGSKNLLNSFRAQNNISTASSQPQQQPNTTNQGSAGYDQSARLHRCMDEDFSLPSNRQQAKKPANNSRYTTASTESNKFKNSKQLNHPKQDKSNTKIQKPAFIETFIHRHTKDFANSLAKRINSKLNFLTECINLQLEQEGILYNALLSDGNSSTDSRDSDADDSILG